MSSNSRKRIVGVKLPLIIVPAVIVLDQLSKYYAIFFGLETVCNKGYAFGVFQGYLNTLVAALVLVIAIYNFSKSARYNLWLGWAFVLGGGLGNMLDRLIRGCVIDFIQVVSFWPSFNIADAAISLGVAILIFSMFTKKFLEE